MAEATHKVVAENVLNSHQNKGGDVKDENTEWSRETQNKLAEGIKKQTAEDLKDLSDTLPVRQVQRGDTLAAIVKGLNGGKLSWGMAVDYQSNKIAADKKPTTLAKADKIYPGQMVWIESGSDGTKKVVVSDEVPLAGGGITEDKESAASGGIPVVESLESAIVFPLDSSAGSVERTVIVPDLGVPADASAAAAESAAEVAPLDTAAVAEEAVPSVEPLQ